MHTWARIVNFELLSNFPSERNNISKCHDGIPASYHVAETMSLIEEEEKL